MDSRPPDRRIQRTKRLLYDSLVALVLERGYDDIRIRDITDHANLGYSTFYLHYDDKDALLTEYLNHVFEGIVQQTRPRRESSPKKDERLGIVTFRYMEDHRELYRRLFHSRGAAVVMRQLRKTIALVVRKDLQIITQGRTSTLPLDLMAHWVAGSVVALIDWWMESDLNYPAEYIVQAYHHLVDPGLNTVLGLQPAKKSAE